MSDTRTNAGVDNISVFKKMQSWTVPGERSITLLSAGNLATTQATISELEERAKAPDDRVISMLETSSMFHTAQMVGQTLRDVIVRHERAGQEADASFNATLILGGQIGDNPPRLFLIYPEGNFIESSADTPFFQIGETKYGKPILVRAYDPDLSFADAVKLLMLSFDSTIKSNLSVGLPLDLKYYQNDKLDAGLEMRIAADNSYYQALSSGWGDALKQSFNQLPDFEPE